MSNDNTESISAKLRRWADDGDTYESPSHCIASKELCIDCPNIPCLKCENKLFNRIADEIDAEKREITERYARQSWMNAADAIVKLATGEIEWDELWQAIDRYYLPRPLFEDGEPVYIGAEIDDRKRGKLEVSRICYTDGGFYFNNSRGSNGRKMKGITYKHGERVGRPKQQVLDAEGVPIEVGDELWSVETGARYIVEKMGSNGRYECHDMLVRDANGTTFRAMGRLYTHREPDTQERIDGDAMKDVYDYWRCNGVICRECPSMIDGEKPRRRYGVDWCSDAKTLDLLRRQRELDGRDA